MGVGDWAGWTLLLHNLLITRFQAVKFPHIGEHSPQMVDLRRSLIFQGRQKDVDTMGYSD